MNFTAKSMVVSPGCLGLPPAPLAGVFFEPVTERLSVSQQLDGPDLQLHCHALRYLLAHLKLH
jgi:hypothetical protein